MNMFTVGKMASRALHALCLSLAVSVMAVVFASPAMAGFGVETFENTFSANQGGLPATQAGSHPDAMVTFISFAHHEDEPGSVVLNGDAKNVDVGLPAGVLVNPAATPIKCHEAELEIGDCPSGSAVGVAVTVIETLGAISSPIFSMVSPPGVPGELGFNVTGLAVVHVVGKLRTGGDYGLSSETADIAQKLSLHSARITLWGNPASPSHDAERGICRYRSQGEIDEERQKLEHGELNSPRCPAAGADGPFLTLPSSCTGEPLKTGLSTFSWQEPGNVLTPAAESPAVTGCEKLDFSPSISVRPEPEAVAADSPTGLTFDMQVPQNESQSGLAEADLKDAVVTLPAGMAVSPSSASGLGACTPAQIGLDNASPASCPDSSKIGAVKIVTPLLEAPLEGSVFLAQQGDLAAAGANPFGSLLALYVVAEGQGALVKLPGEVTLDSVTGQLTTHFGEDPATTLSTGSRQYLPQLPFNELKLSFFGGPRAALITPPTCGTYTVTSRLTPWSGGAPAEPSSSFAVSSGCATGGFAPSFSAGTSNNQAGGFSPLSVTFSRQDGEQRLGGVRITMPPGVLGMLKSVTRCAEPQAAQGACGAESQIGQTTVAAGPGEDPYWVKGGRVYLTGPYKGAPFGLSIVVPALAGPFDLGSVVVSGAAVAVDPHTARITVSSDPLPTILQGIPLDVKTVNVTIDRAGFAFNPTNCSALSVTGTIASTGGASAAVASPFQAANCAALSFKPSFKVSTQAKTSKKNGASLDVKVGSGAGYPLGHRQANISKVAVTLPKQLPARLTTIQQACPEAVFAANSAACPAGSDIGTATVVTPVLASPLMGPAYLVSHGGAAFPDLVVVLQGEGVTLDLVGSIDIKKGVTSSTFASVPDAPISSFELSLPEGPHSGLAAVVPATAKGNLCGQSLVMPTTITGQNGAQIKQSTKIALSGCPKAKKKTKAKHTRGAYGRKKPKHGKSK